MDCVIVASKSFGYGIEKEELLGVFHKYHMDPVFVLLKDARSVLPRARGIIVGTDKVTRETFDSAPCLEVVVKYGVGIDNIDTASARERGIRVLNLPGINSSTVAEMALGLMLAVARKIAAGDRMMRSGAWEGLIGSDVVGKTLGIVGTGAIGCTLAGMVCGLNMAVLGYDRIENPDFTRNGGTYVTLEHLLETSNYVSIHLPLNDETFHFFNSERLARMKRGAILVNTSRGPLVDELALIKALSSGRLSGASLDVFEKEPPEPSELMRRDDTVLTPHIAAYTEETLRRMDEACLSALSGALQNGRRQ